MSSVLRMAPAMSLNVFNSAITKMSEYFFRPGGAYSLAICRIGLFSYLYFHVYKGIVSVGIGKTDYYTTVNTSAYHAKSLVYLIFPATPPSVEFLQITLVVAAISTLCAIIGFITRISMIVSVLSLTFLAAMVFAWEPLWSHPYNSGLIAGIGFMFGRAGDVLSVDSTIARYALKRPIDIHRRVYHWPIILGLFGTATVYFGGFYAKWSTPEWTYNFSWVFSDNLRNSVSLPWLIYGKELPFHIDLIVNNPWLWKLAAFGHLATQALPMMALFSLNRPWLRLAEGFIFVAGVAALKWVMGFWNPEWMILLVFFIDWEYFLTKIGVKFPSTEPSKPIHRPIPILLGAFVFMAVNLIVIVVRYDDRGSSRLFPLSSMNFYSNVAATRPYNKHNHYPFAYGELIFTYNDGSTRKFNCYPAIAKPHGTVFSNNVEVEPKSNFQAGEITAARNWLQSFQARDTSDCNGMAKTANVLSLDFYSSILTIPPYPNQVRFDVGHRALIGRWEAEGNRILAASGQILSGNGIRIAVASQGLNVERYEILLAGDPWKNYDIGALKPASGTWNDNIFTIDSVLLSELKPSWYPYVIRVIETNGHSYDFFGGIIYQY